MRMDKATSAAEIDYTPRERSFKEQLMVGLKMGAVVAVFFLLLWYGEH
ncbi:hypothetical protein [Pseudodesulfovibrio sp. zrk46]|nr:hypothetical protein [Pseudodesulfovibrio sp. zrk46]QJB56225.1 hypothetical protein HFN16_07285 [Pseudodesulfovibrio sp. zrk46]